MNLHRLLALSLIATAASPAYAAGYFTGEKGAHAAGRAGAFTAKADDIMAVAYNPAGLSDVGTTLIQVGNRFSYNSYEYTRKPTLDWGNLENGVPPYVTFDTVANETPWQALDPLVGVATNFGLESWGFAFAIYAPPGVSKMRFPTDGGQRYMMVDREALIVNYNLSAAWQFEKLFGVGLTFQMVAVPKLEYSLVIDGYGANDPEAHPVSSPVDLHARTSGEDLFTPQIILGGWYRPAPYLEVGVSGQVLPTSIKTDSELELDPFSDSLGDAVLERDGEPASDVDLELPLPITARVGVRYIHLEKGAEIFDVELDLAYEGWSRVESFELRSDNLIATVEGDDVPVGDITIEKEWRDTLSVHLGGDYVIVPKRATVRGGVSYESAVSSPAYMNVDFMSGAQLGLAAGGSVFVDKFEIALAYGFRHMFPVSLNEADGRVYPEMPASQCDEPYTGSVCNSAYLGQPGPVVNAGEYRAFTHAVSLDFAYRF